MTTVSSSARVAPSRACTGRARPGGSPAVAAVGAGVTAAGVIGPARPTVYDLADGPKALVELEARAIVGKLALRP